jgi:hypothetical protein
MSQPPDRNDPNNLFDPFGLWKQSQQAMLETWSKSMTDAVNSAPYSEATGRMLDMYLTASAPLRKVIDQTMTQLLNQLSLPSRAEVISLAERMTNIELRLDDLDARLDTIQRGIEQTARAVAALAALAASAPIPASGSANADTANAIRANERPRTGRRGSQPTAAPTQMAPANEATTATTATTRTATKRRRTTTK